MNIKLMISLAFTGVVLQSCGDSQKNVWPSCDQLPVIDSHVFVKTKETDTQLRIPWPSHLIRRVKVDETDKGCDYINSLFITYGWYENKLYTLPEAKGLFKNKEAFRVKVAYNGSYSLQEDAKKSKSNPWRFDGALEHKKFPLNWLPRYLWDDPDNPSPKSLKRATLDNYWAIRDTNYKRPLNNTPFIATCSIPPLDKGSLESRIENEFAKFGDSKCRGWIQASKGDTALSFMVDIWAYKGDYQNLHPISQINLIYDSLVEEFQSYIQE